MEFSFGRIPELAGMLTSVSAVAVFARAAMGSWRGLRNPWVIGWMLVVALMAFAVLTFEMLPPFIRQATPVRAMFLGVVLLGVAAPWLALWAGLRHQHRIDRILGVIGREGVPNEASDVAAALIRHHVESIRDLDTLRRLQPAVARTNGAPQYDWLTPAWIEDRIEAIRLARIGRVGVEDPARAAKHNLNK